MEEVSAVASSLYGNLKNKGGSSLEYKSITNTEFKKVSMADFNFPALSYMDTFSLHT